MNISRGPNQHPSTPRRPLLGLPLLAIIGLALLAVPRVILHDLGLIQGETFVNALLVFVPVAIWIVVALWRRVPNAFLTLLAIGAVYGVFLALGHQLLWDFSFGENAPTLGGNLSDLDPGAGAIIIRTFAVVSSLFTGVIVGVISGLVAWGLSKLIKQPAG